MGDQEFGKCEVCGNEAPLMRKYYYYDIKCKCCNGFNDNHFEYVAHCNNCQPKPPSEIRVLIDPIYIGGTDD